MPEERRTDKRLTTSFPARWEGMTDPQEPRVEDISLGGCFVNTRARVEIDEVINLEIRLPTGNWLGLSGKVISYQPGIGFGLNFSPLTDETMLALRRLQ